MLARVKQDYAAGPVVAFSGREYVRSEWREIPAGFEEQAKNHPLLDTQPSLDEIRAKGPAERGLVEPAPEPSTETAVHRTATPVTAETVEPQEESAPAEPPVEEEPPAEETEPKTPRRRRRAAEE